MNTENWIGLEEYGKKYQVSVSTLRRRLRSGFLEFDLKGGKYFLRDSRDIFKHCPLFMRGWMKPCPTCGKMGRA